MGIHAPPVPGLAAGNWTSGVAVHFAYRALAYAVDDAIYAAMQDGRMEKIFADYGLTHKAPEYR